MKISTILLALPLCIAAMACTESRVIIGGDTGTDGGSADSATDGGTGVACGSATCTGGDVCCNPSCGICTEPGGTCITLECLGPVVCDGEACSGDGAACCAGCRGESFCSGPDGACPDISCPPSCGDEPELCGDGEVCCNACGVEQCLSGEECSLLDCAPLTCDELVCAGGGCCTDCDGFGFCSPGGACPPIDCPMDCAPQDARSDGSECLATFGFAWNGVQCDEIVCGCEGTDCDEAFRTVEQCISAYSACGAAPSCSRDLDCPGAELSDADYCNGCAHGSCPACDDCVAACTANPCATDNELTCRAIRPTCEEGSTAIVAEDGCWQCVSVGTCEPSAD